MKTQKLPLGMRTLHNLDDAFTYQARINRKGISADRRLGTLKEATGWKARIDYLIATDGALSELTQKKSLKSRVMLTKTRPRNSITAPLSW